MSNKGEGMECLGCKLANKKEKVFIVYENDYVCCILDHIPFNEGHVLILPKQHFHDVDELDSLNANAIMIASILITKAIKEIFNPDGITINQNNGMFNELKHYHLHVVPRYQKQNFASFYAEYDGVNIEADCALANTQSKLVVAIKNIIGREKDENNNREH
jgi:diadenosine tetraphosphate (Ap4A) HIT family hydrolase